MCRGMGVGVEAEVKGDGCLAHPHVLEFLPICHGHGQSLFEEVALVAIVHLQASRRHPMENVENGEGEGQTEIKIK